MKLQNSHQSADTVVSAADFKVSDKISTFGWLFLNIKKKYKYKDQFHNASANTPHTKHTLSRDF